MIVQAFLLVVVLFLSACFIVLYLLTSESKPKKKGCLGYGVFKNNDYVGFWRFRKHGKIQGLDKKTDWKVSFFLKTGLDLGIPFIYWLTSGIKIRQSELLDFQDAWFEAIDKQQNWNDKTKKPVKQAATILLRFCEVDNAYFICFHEMIAKSLKLKKEYFAKPGRLGKFTYEKA